MAVQINGHALQVTFQTVNVRFYWLISFKKRNFLTFSFHTRETSRHVGPVLAKAVAQLIVPELRRYKK